MEVTPLEALAAALYTLDRDSLSDMPWGQHLLPGAREHWLERAAKVERLRDTFRGRAAAADALPAMARAAEEARAAAELRAAAVAQPATPQPRGEEECLLPGQCGMRCAACAERNPDGWERLREVLHLLPGATLDQIVHHVECLIADRDSMHRERVAEYPGSLPPAPPPAPTGCAAVDTFEAVEAEYRAHVGSPCPAVEPGTGHACSGEKFPGGPGSACVDGVHICDLASNGGCLGAKSWRTPPHPEATHGMDGRALPSTAMAEFWDQVTGPVCPECSATDCEHLARRAPGDKETHGEEACDATAGDRAGGHAAADEGGGSGGWTAGSSQGGGAAARQDERHRSLQVAPGRALGEGGGDDFPACPLRGQQHPAGTRCPDCGFGCSEPGDSSYVPASPLALAESDAPPSPLAAPGEPDASGLLHDRAHRDSGVARPGYTARTRPAAAPAHWATDVDHRYFKTACGLDGEANEPRCVEWPWQVTCLVCVAQLEATGAETTERGYWRRCVTAHVKRSREWIATHADKEIAGRVAENGMVIVHRKVLSLGPLLYDVEKYLACTDAALVPPAPPRCDHCKAPGHPGLSCHGAAVGRGELVAGPIEIAPPRCDKPGHMGVTCERCCAESHEAAEEQWEAWGERKEAGVAALEAQLATLRATVAEGSGLHEALMLEEAKAVRLTRERDEARAERDDMNASRLNCLDLLEEARCHRDNLLLDVERLKGTVGGLRNEVQHLRGHLDHPDLVSLSPADAALVVELLDQERSRIGTLACHTGPAADRVAGVGRVREALTKETDHG